MEGLNETLLSSWIRLSNSVCNQKLSSEMPYKESLICGILYRHTITHPDTLLTATDLCQIAHMQKSQMNRTLTSMEAKHVIQRERSTKDRRRIFVSLNEDQLGKYHEQHRNLLEMIDKLIVKIGISRAQEAVSLLDSISLYAKEIFE